MDRSEEQRPRGRSRALVAGALVLTTAVVGAAARGTGTRLPIAPEWTTPSTFTAPSGGPVTFRGTVDRTAVLRGTDGLVRMELVIAAHEQPVMRPARVPTDLMVILDRSGSMAGTKIDQARAAVRELVTQLGRDERFGLVTYFNEASLVVPLTTADDRTRDRWFSTVGVGADFNEYLMTALADAGTGNYYYLHSGDDLTTVFAREFGAARATIASGLAVQIAPAGDVRVVDAAGYPLEPAPGRTPGAVVFRPGALFAGQERRVWVTLAVPSQTVGAVDLGSVSLSYAVGDERTTLALADVPRVACVEGEDDFYAGIDVSAWTRSVLVDGYNALQQQVAREVKAGRLDDARRAIQQFRDDTATLNARVQSAPVANGLLLVDELETEVSAAFTGADQREKQNALSKARGAVALDERRAGSKQ